MESRRELAEARVGQTLRGKWRLDALVGVGGMASVYAATHRNGYRGAVKIPHRHVAADPTLRLRFLVEARSTNVIRHPGVVAVLDDDESEEGEPFLVMELLEGTTAEEAFRSSGPFSWEEVLRVAGGLLEALAAAHELGIVHRDIKPDNVFLCNDGRVKILDFGIARTEEGASLTQTGATLGTPAYMAPEQAIGQRERIGKATDVWAVGATMFTLLTGRFVHQGASINETLILAATCKAPSIGTLRPLPPGVTSLIDKALSFEPEHRFQDAGAMLAALRRVQAVPSSVSFAATELDPNAATLAATPTPVVAVEGKQLAPKLAAPRTAVLPNGQGPLRSNLELGTAPTEMAVPTPRVVSSATTARSPGVRRLIPGFFVASMLTAGVVGWRLAHRAEPPSVAFSTPLPDVPAAGVGVSTLPVVSVIPSAMPVAPASSIPPASPPSPSFTARRTPAAPPRPTPLDTLYDRRQ